MPGTQCACFCVPGWPKPKTGTGSSDRCIMADTHLMIVHPRSASLIMTGQKLVEACLGHDRRAPFDRVEPGDTVFIKPTGQTTIGKAIVQRVDQYEGLTPEDIDRLHSIYNDRVMGDESFWDSKRDASYATFITLDRVRMVQDESLVPASLLAPGRTAWRMLSDGHQQSQAA